METEASPNFASASAETAHKYVITFWIMRGCRKKSLNLLQHKCSESNINAILEHRHEDGMLYLFKLGESGYEFDFKNPLVVIEGTLSEVIDELYLNHRRLSETKRVLEQEKEREREANIEKRLRAKVEREKRDRERGIVRRKLSFKLSKHPKRIRKYTDSELTYFASIAEAFLPGDSCDRILRGGDLEKSSVAVSRAAFFAYHEGHPIQTIASWLNIVPGCIRRRISLFESQLFRVMHQAQTQNHFVLGINEMAALTPQRKNYSVGLIYR